MQIRLDTINLILRWFGLVLVFNWCPDGSYANELVLTTRTKARKTFGLLVGDPGWSRKPSYRELLKISQQK